MYGNIQKLLICKNKKYLIKINEANQLEMLSYGNKLSKEILSLYKIKEFDCTVDSIHNIYITAITLTNALVYIKIDSEENKYISKLSDSPQNSSELSDPFIFITMQNSEFIINIFFISLSKKANTYIMHLHNSVIDNQWNVTQVAAIKSPNCRLLHVSADPMTVYLSASISDHWHIYSAVKGSGSKWTPLVSVCTYPNEIISSSVIKTDKSHIICQCADGIYFDNTLLCYSGTFPIAYIQNNLINVVYFLENKIEILYQTTVDSKWEKGITVKDAGYLKYRTNTDSIYTLGFDFPLVNDIAVFVESLSPSEQKLSVQAVENDLHSRIRKLENDIYLHEKTIYALEAQLKQCIRYIEELRYKILKINTENNSTKSV